MVDYYPAGRPNRPHYWSCSFVRPSVCLVYRLPIRRQNA